MGLFRKKRKVDELDEPVNELLVVSRSIWEQETFNNALKKYYQSRYYSSSDGKKAQRKFEEIVVFYEPYVIWQKMKPFRDAQQAEWEKFCDKKNIDYDSFKERDFLYELLCKKYGKKIYATDAIPDFNDEISCDKEFLGSFFNGYVWSGAIDKINEYKEMIYLLRIKDDDLDELWEGIDYKVAIRNQIIETIKGSEGAVKQADLKNHIENIPTGEISQACSSLEKFDVIRRQKSGSSYLITIL